MRTPHLRAVSAPQTLQVALYARVSSDQQAERHTIDSQLAELVLLRKNGEPLMQQEDLHAPVTEALYAGVSG
jgi:hypothetical protein